MAVSNANKQQSTFALWTFNFSHHNQAHQSATYHSFIKTSVHLYLHFDFVCRQQDE